MLMPSVYLMAISAAAIWYMAGHDMSMISKIVGIATGILGIIGLSIYEYHTKAQIDKLKDEIKRMKFGKEGNNAATRNNNSKT